MSKMSEKIFLLNSFFNLIKINISLMVHLLINVNNKELKTQIFSCAIVI